MLGAHVSIRRYELRVQAPESGPPFQLEASAGPLKGAMARKCGGGGPQPGTQDRGAECGKDRESLCFQGVPGPQLGWPRVAQWARATALAEVELFPPALGEQRGACELFPGEGAFLGSQHYKQQQEPLGSKVQGFGSKAAR